MIDEADTISLKLEREVTTSIIKQKSLCTRHRLVYCSLLIRSFPTFPNRSGDRGNDLKDDTHR